VENAELIAILREVRERVAARYPAGEANGIALPDLEPLLHARDAAMAKVASIGTVNPRGPGFSNGLIQRLKNFVARALDWHVREQVVFNRQMMACIDAALEALNDTSRALSQLGSRIAVAEELKDIRSHWAEWRQDWEHKLQKNEIQFLRSVADLQAAYAHRADLMDASYRDTARGQHADFTASLERTSREIQAAQVRALETMKLEYDRMIHEELRLIRQRLAPAGAAPLDQPASPEPVAASVSPGLDYTRLAQRFRGPEETVKARQQFYLEYFKTGPVLDLGCGRGEFLDLLKTAGVQAGGVDANPECVAACREKGLSAETADMFGRLRSLPESSLSGIFCSQVVEHLPPARVPELVALCASRLAPGGVLAFETPNPECLAIFATYFYLDPTHVRPVPAQLMQFYCEESGLGVVALRRFAPAVEAIPALASLPADLRDAIFGSLDYAIIARKL
jgi:2-polyprenyl-3-methyl-5-hydroxy-6-metoxy-1,4-benzoquinol methylase